MSAASFNERARQPIGDETLQAALAKATNRFRTERGHAMELVDFERMRRQARTIRDATLARLDQHLAQFAEAARQRGMVVHWAADASAAIRIVTEIARANGVKEIVKSKSMATEEIELNPALEAAGLHPSETDLGEWIVQLAGQHPSHIVAPAVHLTRGQVAAILARETGGHVPDDIPSLTATARRELRSRFLSAQMGISGVNFAVAETGTLVIVTNEGNGRFVTGLPPVHVAIMGIEKVVPTWDDLGVLLALLPRSATGQAITSYVNFVAGPQSGEGVEPNQVHVVIFDNGRTGLLGTTYQESLRCIRCGACINVCPVYHEVGGHTYDAATVGPIGAVQMPALKGLKRFHDLPHASSLCFACRDVCPVMIDLPRLLLELRREEAEGARPTVGLVERLGFRLFGWGASQPWLYRLAVRALRILQAPFARHQRIRSAPFPLSLWTRNRDFPAVAAKTFQESWKPDE